MGFANKFTTSRDICDCERNFYRSKQCTRSIKKQGRNMFEINVRAIAAFREIGRGLEAINSFSRCINMNSISDPRYRNINEQLCKANKIATNNSIKRAADEVASSSPTHQSSIPLARAKIDVARQKRGYSSANGVVTVTVGNTCVDTHVLSKHCKQCQIWEIQQGTPEYGNGKDSHVCSVNHTASLGAMEAAGATEMFLRSIGKSNLIYHEYLTDVDTSFKAVVDSKPYEKYNITPTKLECAKKVGDTSSKQSEKV